MTIVLVTREGETQRLDKDDSPVLVNYPKYEFSHALTRFLFAEPIMLKFRQVYLRDALAVYVEIAREGE